MRLPLVLAPMAGVTPPEIVIRACESSILGSLGAGMLSPTAIREQIAQIKKGTDRDFNVNLFVVDDSVRFPETTIAKQQWLYSLASAHGFQAKAPDLRPPYAHKFSDQFAAMLEMQPPIASFTFGLISRDQIAQCHERKIKVWGTATTPHEVALWREAGADTVVLQSTDAGGHQGSLKPTQEPSMATLDDMWESAKDAAGDMPLVVAGGIMDGATAARWISRGAYACQLGTLFLGATDMPLHPAWKRAITGEFGTKTRPTRIFSGRWARSIVSTAVSAAAEETRDKDALPYPAQLAFTAPLRAESIKREEPGFTSLWAGSGFAQCRALPVATIIEALVNEYSQSSEKL